MNTIITYAGNFEDIILKELFSNIVGGYYVDIGANNPILGSVTKIFYDMGWHGINIDPLPEIIKEYDIQRKRDINLNIGVGEKEDFLEYISADVFSTFNPDNFGLVENYCKKNNIPFKYDKIQVNTIKNVLDEYVLPDTDIHFMKIDVENYELQVLRGMDFTKYRPWCICIECVKQFSSDTIYDLWENILIENKYFFCKQYDGNRFYISNEHRDLKEKFIDLEEVRKNYRVCKIYDEKDVNNLIKIAYSKSYRLGYSLLQPFRKVKFFLK